MRKISNPYRKIPGYNCFGCSPDNQEGLRMEFYEEGDEILCEWEPTHRFHGYLNVLHGGIQSTLIDEIACWVVLVKLKTGGVTSRLDVKMKKPVVASKGKITLRAKLVSVKLKIAEIFVELKDAEGVVCTTGTVYYYTFPFDVSVKKYYYPEDYNEFFTE